MTETLVGALAAGEWVVTAIGAVEVDGATRPTLTFTREGHVSGSTGINRFSGGSRLEGDALTISPLLMTRMAGPPELMDQERRFAAALEGVATVALDDRILTLGGVTPLTLRAAAPGRV